MYKGWPVPEKLCISFVQVLEEAIKKGIWRPAQKTFVIYGEDTAWGRSFGKAFKTQLEEAGWTMVDEEYFAKEQSVFYPWLTKLKNLNPDLMAGTSTVPSSLAVLINQADEIRLQSLIIADGLGWFGGWYALTGKSSNHVIDQIPGWATEKGKQYAVEFEKRWGIKPSPSAAGLAYDGTNFFIAVAKAAIEQYGELSSESIYKFVKEHVWTGKWTYTDGIVMAEYAATPDTIPDPVVGKGYYIFPVLQYFDGVGKIIFPPEWAEQELIPKP
jgi:branched-chain amino acid transport system substrate-binding protein